MKFFIDTADIPEIEELMPSGLIDGVTTNPSLIAKSGKDMGETIKTICSIVSGPVSAEVTATEYDKMLEEGQYLASLAKNVAVKVPLTPAGLQTCKALREKDIMVTKKELKKALNSKESTRTEKKPIDAKLHAKNVHNKFKEICSDRGEMPL